jgi:hypothetical protein
MSLSVQHQPERYKELFKASKGSITFPNDGTSRMLLKLARPTSSHMQSLDDAHGKYLHGLAIEEVQCSLGTGTRTNLPAAATTTYTTDSDSVKEEVIIEEEVLAMQLQTGRSGPFFVHHSRFSSPFEAAGTKAQTDLHVWISGGERQNETPDQGTASGFHLSGTCVCHALWPSEIVAFGNDGLPIDRHQARS